MSDDPATLMRFILATSPGFDLDKIIATILFQEKLEECSICSTKYHLVGAQHFDGNVEGKELCTSPVPKFSTEWNYARAILEWLTSHFPGLEVVWDCDHWSCNIDMVEEKHEWFRLAHVPGAKGFQEAICKAALLVV